MTRTLYQDKFNSQKVWEVTSISHGFYLKQFICGKQFGRGLKTSKEYIKSIVIFDMQILSKEEK